MEPRACNARYESESPAMKAVCWFILSTIFLLSAISQARAAGTVNVDQLVATDFTPMVVGQTAKRYTTEVTIRNDSMTDILSPLQLVVTSISNSSTRLDNADGVSGGDPYILIEVPGGVLLPGDSTAPAVLEFVRRAGNSAPGSSGNGNNKNANFPAISFTSSVFGGAAVAPAVPTSSPNAVPAGDGDVDVVFSIGVTGDTSLIQSVTLRSLDGGGDSPANDLGNNGDAQSGDNHFGTTVSVSTSGLAGGQCLSYVGVIDDGMTEFISPTYLLCATQFPLQIAESDSSAGNLITTGTGDEVIANEVLVQFVKNTSEDKISQIIKSVKAAVIGTVLPVNLYQLSIPAAGSEDELNAVIARLENNPEVIEATPNGLVEFSSQPDDTIFNQPGSQHALLTIRADDAWGDSTQPDPWDNGIATGSGVTVGLLDLGVDATHSDLAGQVVTPAPALSVPVGDGNTDTDGHGTAMAGIIAAATDNGIGIAGTAPGVQLQSVKVAAASGFTNAELIQGYQNLASPAVTASIVNASVNSVSTSPSIPGLCQAIDNAINSGTGKLIVNSAGNQGDNGNRWPARCNDADYDSIRAAADRIANKARFIVVAASACTTPPCATDSKQTDSNFGRMVDVAAPGVNVDSTELGNTYGTRDRTSPASALVTGAAAILHGCGVGLDNIESTLLSGTLVGAIPYPSEPLLSGGSSPAGTTPRIDVYQAMLSINSAPSAPMISNSTLGELPSPSSTTVSPLAVGTLSAASTDSCDRITFSKVGGADAAAFEIVGGQLRFVSGVALDFETKSSFNVTVRGTDFFGLTTADLPIVVSLADVDEAPTIAPQVRNVDENETVGTNVGAPIAAGDEDAGASLSFAITGGNSGGAFAINASTGQITVANTAALDFETTPVFNLTVQVTDTGDAPPLNASATVTINLNDVAEAIPNPTIVFTGFVDYDDAFGNPFRRWEFDVTNAASFPAELFEISASFPCLPNPTASRSRVIYFDAATDTPLNTFCALGSPASMNGTWFARPRPGDGGIADPAPPAGVYMKIVDQLTAIEYQSNTVTGLPNPDLTP